VDTIPGFILRSWARFYYDTVVVGGKMTGKALAVRRQSGRAIEGRTTEAQLGDFGTSRRSTTLHWPPGVLPKSHHWRGLPKSGVHEDCYRCRLRVLRLARVKERRLVASMELGATIRPLATSDLRPYQSTATRRR
jgi:hypothetical protein